MGKFERDYIENRIERVTESGCWIWTGPEGSWGYGAAFVKAKRYRAHRFVFKYFNGPIPKGMQLDHLCRVRCCVNPNHLEPVTHRTNILRGVGHTAINHTKTHCNRGHEFTKENTYCVRLGKHINGMRRVCRTCAINRTRLWRAKKESKDAK